jgi:hypothetical protein
MSKFIQQLTQGLALGLSHHSPAIKRRERLSLSKLQHHPHPWHPVRAFGMNQMAHHIKRAPGVFAFIARRPHFRQVTQKRIEGTGGAGEK